MIKFFRKIRQKLLTENKYSAYLLYAFGEILLVVIGILIALQVNDWNEARKNNDLEQRYLSAIQGEFSYNKENLLSSVKTNKRNYMAGLEILQHSGPTVSEISEAKFDSLLINSIGTEVRIKPRNEVLNELIGSGKLSIIHNIELRNAFSAWSGSLERIRAQEQELSKYRYQILDLSMEQINLRQAVHNATRGTFGLGASRFPKTNTKILQIQEFESRFTSFVGASKFMENAYELLDQDVENILNLISNEMRVQGKSETL